MSLSFELAGIRALPMLRNKQALIPYLLLVAALAGGLALA